MFNAPSLAALALSSVLAACAGSSTRAASATRAEATSAEATRAEATSAEATRAFFERYVALSQSHDPAQLDLYADDARVRALRHTATGDQELVLTGAQLKPILRKVLEAAASYDREVFSQVVISTTRAGAHVAAHRYAQLRCTHDDDFALDIEPDAAGALHIVAAFQQSWAESQCGLGEGKSPAQRFDEIVGATAPMLPLEVDEQTQLDTLSRKGDWLLYGYKLVNVNAEQIDTTAPAFKAAYLATLAEHIESSCRTLPHLALALRDGGRIHFSYADAHGKTLMSFTVRPQDCER